VTGPAVQNEKKSALRLVRACSTNSRILITTVLLISAPLLCTAAEKRVALVIGNSAYQNVTPLDNPRNDAVLLARTLKDEGFTLIGDSAQLNLDKVSLDRVVQSFGQQAQRADIALFYYAGHGVQVRGSNYLVPVDANPSREADVDFQMLDLRLVLHQMDGPGTRLKLVILDACRNNPFGLRGLRGAEGGLAQMRAPEGTLISYATQPGNVAQDGTDGDSPYSKALANTMRVPGLDIFQTFNQVGLLVERATDGEQQPWTSSSPINGNFYFAGPAVSAAASTESAARLTGSAQAGAQAPRSVSRTPATVAPDFPAPAEFYPQESRKLNERGTAIVRACVATDTTLAAPPTIALSSGFSRLDEAALKLASAGHYVAATEDGKHVPSCFMFGVRFALEGVEPASDESAGETSAGETSAGAGQPAGAGAACTAQQRREGECH
jgi:hypothetical protein